MLRHWSEIEPGDVVQTTSSSWTRVDRLDLSIGGLVAVVGRDVGGPRRDEQVTRWLSKGRPLAVRTKVSLLGSLPDRALAWTRRSIGSWVSGPYEVRRERAGGLWSMERDGVVLGTDRSLSQAKITCAADRSTASERFLRGEAVPLVDFLRPASSSTGLASADRASHQKRRS